MTCGLYYLVANGIYHAIGNDQKATTRSLGKLHREVDLQGVAKYLRVGIPNA